MCLCTTVLSAKSEARLGCPMSGAIPAYVPPLGFCPHRRGYTVRIKGRNMLFPGAKGCFLLFLFFLLPAAGRPDCVRAGRMIPLVSVDTWGRPVGSCHSGCNKKWNRTPSAHQRAFPSGTNGAWDVWDLVEKKKNQTRRPPFNAGNKSSGSNCALIRFHNSLAEAKRKGRFGAVDTGFAKILKVSWVTSPKVPCAPAKSRVSG